MIKGILHCFIVAAFSWMISQSVSFITAPITALICGIMWYAIRPPKSTSLKGIQFTNKKILQFAIVLLGFGLNFQALLQISLTTAPIIAISITGALISGALLSSVLSLPKKLTLLISVGTAICGGSAIAATAPVIDADEQDIAQAISIIFIFNLLAALLFPLIGQLLALSHQGFAIFSGTAVNDTSSVTAVASSWDRLHQTGTFVLDMATIIKLTRTLAIIPIILTLSFLGRHRRYNPNTPAKSFPVFILYFIAASCFTTLIQLPMFTSIERILLPLFTTFKHISQFLIVMSMAGIGLSTPLAHLLKTGKQALLLGFYCWGIVIICTLGLQHILNLL